jgi:hypothetical protein
LGDSHEGNRCRDGNHVDERKTVLKFPIALTINSVDRHGVDSGPDKKTVIKEMNAWA